MGRWRHPFRTGLFIDNELRQFAADTCAAVEMLAAQTEVLAMGFEWRQYAQFDSYGGLAHIADGSVIVLQYRQIHRRRHTACDYE